MDRFLVVVLLFSISIFCKAQDPDAVSGETLTMDQLDRYMADSQFRAVYNNDNFDNIPVVKLEGNIPVIAGEIINQGPASFKDCELRSVVVKEIIPGEQGGDPEFIGAFQYYGYPLADIVKDVVVDKLNKEEFGLNLDLYVLVENSRGDSAIFSWGELFFSVRGNDIILATEVRPVFPTSSDTKWELPKEYKIIAGNDFLSVRNISNPVKVTILSSPFSFPGKKGTTPLYSPDLIIKRGSMTYSINNLAEKTDVVKMNSVFFGLHKGLRRITTFEGVSLGDALQEMFSFTPDDIQKGMLVVGAKDGYRVLYSLSEIINRSDNNAFILTDSENLVNGRYNIFPGGDFFADRHLKGAMTGYIFK